jgi:hypothetical protein
MTNRSHRFHSSTKTQTLSFDLSSKTLSQKSMATSPVNDNARPKSKTRDTNTTLSLHEVAVLGSLMDACDDHTEAGEHDLAALVDSIGMRLMQTYLSKGLPK